MSARSYGALDAFLTVVRNDIPAIPEALDRLATDFRGGPVSDTGAACEPYRPLTPDGVLAEQEAHVDMVGGADIDLNHEEFPSDVEFEIELSDAIDYQEDCQSPACFAHEA